MGVLKMYLRYQKKLFKLSINNFMEETILKVFMPTAIAFVIGILITPLITHHLYRLKAWKKKSGKGNGYGGGETPLFDELHKEKDTNTPRMGGIVIWVSVCLTIFLFSFLGYIFPNSIFSKLDFLSRSQTWLPLFALMVGAIVGLLDDLLVIKDTGKHFAGGLPLSQRLFIVSITAAFSGWWFYEKLEVSSVSFFNFGPIELGLLFIPFFIFVSIAVYASSIIDGIDGLAGGVFLFVFTAYTGIAFYQSQFDIAAFTATITGGILAFLWFNIPPARFYMTETGVMALTMSLTIVAFMTDVLGEGEGVSMLPIVGFLLLMTVATNIIQLLSKKLLGKKVFLVAPIHHHFEALGWSHAKVAMRYWVLGFVFAVIGLLLTIAI
jgi:phospho-N-acetylmuramoyl-pentapeptide-transferase